MSVHALLCFLSLTTQIFHVIIDKLSMKLKYFNKINANTNIYTLIQINNDSGNRSHNLTIEIQSPYRCSIQTRISIRFFSTQDNKQILMKQNFWNTMYCMFVWINNGRRNGSCCCAICMTVHFACKLYLFHFYLILIN